MGEAVRIRTTVLPGNRVEVATPELSVGQTVEVIILPDETVGEALEDAPRRTVLEFLDSLPPRPHSDEAWAEIERQFQEERDAWER